MNKIELLEKRYGVLLQFKYIKQEELKAIPNLRSYAIVVIKDKIEVEEL